MPSSDFPSGPWTGYYQYPSKERGGQDLWLTFQGGQMSGHGNDEAGTFQVSGNYNEEEKEAEWTKSYPDGHRVHYRGFREGAVPGIWGTWSIPGDSSGGFHIWPLPGTEVPESVEEQETIQNPVRRREPAMMPG